MDIFKKEISRKDMMKLGLLGGAALFLPLERVARTEHWRSGDTSTSQLPTPFQVPFSAPPVLKPVRTDATTDYYEMTMKSAKVPIIPGKPDTEIYGYNGISPGPTIEVEKGRDVVVRQINGLPQTSRFGYKTTTSVHLHGNASKPQYDGYAEDVTPPGYYKDYVYPNFQDARMLWYHDHAIHHTAQNAYMGLAGCYISHDDLEKSLPIPKGKYDVPLVIRDALFDSNAQLVYDDQDQSGFMGDVVLVNGLPWPVMKVERRKYRFRILNASVSRSYKLALSTGDPLTVIGTDGGLMPKPQQTADMRLGMAERYEVVIDFAKYPVGTKVDLKNLGLPNNSDYTSTRDVMRFEVAGEATDTANNEVPAELNPQNEVMKLTASQAVRTREFKFNKGELWNINGKIWDKNRVDANPGLGDIEIWELKTSRSGWFHPVHIHLSAFKILDRNGNAPFNYERGPKDVAYVGENETVRVLMKFGPQKGKYMMHCHNLVHEDHDMMTQFEVGTGGDDPITADPPKPYDSTTPAL